MTEQNREQENQIGPEQPTDFATDRSASIHEIASQGIDLLRQLIAIPSLSGEESETGDLIAQFFEERGYQVERTVNNIVVRSRRFDSSRPTVLFNSHHDTVPPSSGYTRSPYEPYEEDGRLYGLGSNDAGGPLVSLLSAFLLLDQIDQERDLGIGCNLIVAATGEEETAGTNGIAIVLPQLGPIEFGIVGEPTSLEIASAEKGLMVLDCVSHGRSGHAARLEGENAIYLAMKDIDWFRTYQFENESELLGPVRMSVTMIDSGSAHNVVPDRCHFVVDVRTTDSYSNRETLDIICSHVGCEVTPRSLRLNPSGLPHGHRLYAVAEQLGIRTYGSPTLSDQARMDFPTIKFGPGDSARSHTDDEYIDIDQIPTAIGLIVDIVLQLYGSSSGT